jgi:hypothetical protein
MNYDVPSQDEIREMRRRVAGWLIESNLAAVKGRQINEIFELYGRELEPVAFLPPYYAEKLDTDIKDCRVYSSKAYFLDHAANHHAEVPVADYDNIQDIIDGPEDVRKRGKTLLFFKKFDRYSTVIIGVGKNDEVKGFFHISFFNISEKSKRQYDRLEQIEIQKTSPVDDHPTVGPACAAAIGLHALDDN